MRQTTGIMSASRAAATIAATQTTEVKKKKRKRVGSAVSVDMATASSDIETINAQEEEDDAKLPDAAVVAPAKTPRKVAATEERVMETPRRAVAVEERSRLGADVLADVRSQKRVRRARLSPSSPYLGPLESKPWSCSSFDC
jgi:hypothetical protein